MSVSDIRPDAALEMERLLTQLALHSRVGVAVKERDGRYLWTNSSYTALHGIRYGSAIGRRDADLLEVELTARRGDREERVWQSGHLEPFEDTLGHPPVILLGQLIPLRGLDGRPLLGITCTRAPQGHRLEQLTALRRRLVAPDLAGPVGAYEFDVATQETTWSGEMWSIYGYTGDADPPGWEMVMEHQRPDLEIVEAEVADYMATGRPFSFVHRITRLDGTIRTVHSRGTVEMDENGTPVRLRGTEQDLTDHLASREDLQELFDFQEQVLDSVAEAVCVLDARGCIVFANGVAAAHLGEADDDLHGTLLHTRLTATDAGARIRDTLEQGLPTRITRTGVERGRGGLVLEGLITPLQRHGELDGAVVTLRDITQREQRDHALRTTMRELHDTNREREQLLRALVDAQESERRSIAADVHDDSLQVMSAVGLGLDQLEPKIADPAARESLEFMRNEVRAATSRLRELLFTLTPPALELGIAAAVGVYARRLTDETSLTVEVVDEVDVEPPKETRLVLYRIAQEALLNIIRHARARHITVTARRYPGSLVLSIDDDGVGMGQVEPEPGHVGLSSMRHRAELAGGRLFIVSGQSGGTTVTALLPFDDTAQDAATSSSASA